MSKNYGQDFETARARVFHLLEDGEWHGWKELRRVGGVRYSARLLELRREGYAVESEPIVDGEHGKRYRMPELRPGQPQGKRVKVFLEEGDVERMLDAGVITKPARNALHDALGSFQHNKHKL